ncbi:MAG TPA: DUF1801 domain-containing protein [Oceanospirillales bacterium]|nr:DUF1801 domain-containing protein [Oceanospirillales bacterium]
MISNLETEQVIQQYPQATQDKLLIIRKLIIDTSHELNINDLQETLKWGEPSYTCKQGSTIRLAWKAKFPNQLGVYFNCKTTLIENIKEIYPTTFIYEGKRALILKLNAKIPLIPIKNCITFALKYHQIKQQPVSKWLEILRSLC